MMKIEKRIETLWYWFWSKIPKSLIRFMIVGGIGTLVNLMIYQCCILLSIPPLISSTIAFSFCSIENYIINQKWSFNEKDDTQLNLTKFIKYYVVNLGGLIVNLIILNVYISIFGTTYSFIGQGCGILVAFLFNYVSSSFFVFYRKKKIE